MKKKNNTNTILFFLLLILFVIFLLYTFASFKEGIEINSLRYTGYNNIYKIYFRSSDIGEQLYIDLSYNRVKYDTYSKIPASYENNKRWRFYLDTNNSGKYYIKNVGTQKCLGFKQNSDGKTYLVGYKDPEELSTIIPNSNLWSVTVTNTDYDRHTIHIRLNSIDSKITRGNNNFVLKENKTEDKNITLIRL